jgi:hypothetical protein
MNIYCTSECSNTYFSVLEFLISLVKSTARERSCTIVLAQCILSQAYIETEDVECMIIMEAM